MLAAELAVSRAKQLGRNRVCRFDSLPGADPNADPYQLHRFLKDESLATIQALAAAVDAKDPYTQGHSQRVAEYAVALARQIGLDEDEVTLLHTTAHCTMSARSASPMLILKKPGRLDDDERQIMETHPALGEVIVRKAPKLAADPARRPPPPRALGWRWLPRWPSPRRHSRAWRASWPWQTRLTP